MIVIDASAAVAAVADGGDTGDNSRHRLRGAHLASPDLVRVEGLSALRRHEAAGTLDVAQTQRAVDALMGLPILVFPTAPLLARAWQLRDNLTPYDACYVSLAEALNCPLVTADSRLSRSPGITCEVEVI